MLTKNDLNQIRGVVQEEIEPVKKDVKSLNRKVSQLQRTQNTMLDLLDKEQMQQRKRIIRLEEHVGISNPQ